MLERFGVQMLMINLRARETTYFQIPSPYKGVYNLFLIMFVKPGINCPQDVCP
jgi:hypothetical protein